MLVDNCPAHPAVGDLKAITLKFLPLNTTSHLQPMDQGIIQYLKVFCRKLIMEHIIRMMDNGQGVDNKMITVLDAIHMMHSAWHQMKPDTISSCFRHAGFTSLNTSAGAYDDQQQQQPVCEHASEATTPRDHGNIWERLRAAGLCITEDLSFNDFTDVDGEVSVAVTRTDSEIVAAIG